MYLIISSHEEDNQVGIPLAWMAGTKFGAMLSNFGDYRVIAAIPTRS